ncbi:protein dhs-3-like [Panonychus citri]|uniref:protein dhs-3-like n=1 Tax=Panonychus citri TaxID=50023 RepID=UPI002307366C|nr:protein dhs-3-like [Panonychus citri]
MILFLFNVLIFVLEFFQLIGKVGSALFERFKQFIFAQPKKLIKGQTVLITGGGGAIGRQLAIKLGKEGAKIIVWDINAYKGEETIREVRKKGGLGFFYQVDVSDFKAVGDALAKIYETLGSIDILINNAGILNALPLTQLGERAITDTIRINLLAQIWTTKQILPRMIASGKGQIVAISSNSAIYGKTFLTDYSASKAGIIGFMSSLEEELRYLKKDFIKLTTICPAAIDSGLSQAVETRFPRLLPILDVNRATDIMVDNILREDAFVIMPTGYKILYYILRNLPREIEVLVRDFIGNTVEAKHVD